MLAIANQVKYKAVFFFFLIVLTYFISIIFFHENGFHLVKEFGGFFLVGILGAIAAVGTGAGGGVVFIPVFNHIGLDATAAVDTSLAIQCFGMTVGAITWYQYNSNVNSYNKAHISYINSVFIISIICALLGILFCFALNWQNQIHVNVTFGVFSLLLSLLLFIQLKWKPAKKSFSSLLNLTLFDKICLPVLCFVGGVITSWISVGLGEIIAVFFILRGYHIYFAVSFAVSATAVIVLFLSAIKLITGNSNIEIEILMFTAPGAVLGGAIARYLVVKISVKYFKSIFALYVFLIGIIELF